MLGSGSAWRFRAWPRPCPPPPKEVGAISTEPKAMQFPIPPIDIHALPSIANIALRQGCGRSVRRGSVSVEHFRRRADECRHLASVARNASDKEFWLGLVERWQALEVQKLQQPARDKFRSPFRRRSEPAQDIGVQESPTAAG